MADNNLLDDDVSLHNGPLYKDTLIPKDNSIKISSTNKDTYTPAYKDTGKDSRADSPYDYYALRSTLRDEMDKPITIEQAEQIGIALVNLFDALYFDES